MDANVSVSFNAPQMLTVEHDRRLAHAYIMQSVLRMWGLALLALVVLLIPFGLCLFLKGESPDFRVFYRAAHPSYIPWLVMLPSILAGIYVPITATVGTARRNLQAWRNAGTALTWEMMSFRVSRELSSPFDASTTIDLCAEALSGLAAGMALGYGRPPAFAYDPFRGKIVIGFRDPLWLFNSIDASAQAAPGQGVVIRVRRRLGPGILGIQNGEALRAVEAIATYLREQLHSRSVVLENLKKGRELERVALSAKLSALQAQVEPHFLFNTLANLKYLIRTNEDLAQRMVDHLVGYLHNALPDMRAASSTLGRELDLARDYLSIMRLRMGERLRFRIDAPDDQLNTPFPPAMLISLVENAVKHGLERATRSGTIEIIAAVEGRRLWVHVRDDGIGLTEVAGPGMGLANIHDRLPLLYGKEASLSVASRPDAGVEAILCIPLPASGE